MGLTTLPTKTVGSLGQVKQDRPLAYPDLRREIVADEWEANTTALIGVCNEVGLSDGSTSGSLVERVTDLEAAGGLGDVVGPASSVDDRLVTFDGVTGKLIQDSGVAIGAIAAAQSTADAAIPKPGGTTVDGRVAVISGTSGAAIAEGSKLESDLVTGPASAVSGNIATFNGTTGKIVQDSLIPSIALLFLTVSTHDTSTKTLASTDTLKRFIVDVDAISGDCTVTIPHTVAAGTYCEFRLDGTAGDLIFGVSGGSLAAVYFGQNTCTVDGSVATVFMESATRVEITIVEPV